MKKVMNYIVNGQGLGIRFLLTLSVIVSVIVSVYIKIAGDVGVPYVQEIAEQILPIKIEDGTVVEPYNTVKNINLFEDLDIESNDDFLIVIDTTVDTLNVTSLDYGVYLTRKAIYIVSPRETKVQKLEGDIDIPMDDYTPVFDKFVNWMAIFIFPFSLIFVFFAYFILTIFYATCAIIVCSIMNKKFDFDFRMRMSTIAFIATYLVFIPLGWIGITSNWLFFFAVIGLQALIIKEAEPALPQAKKRTVNKI